MNGKMRPARLFGLFILLFALGAGAEGFEVGRLARVVNCKEFITLREEPQRRGWKLRELPLSQIVLTTGDSENGFEEVFSMGEIGWALSEYLEPVPEAGEPIALETAARMNLNIFLTVFTRVGFSAYLAGEGSEGQLMDFAIDYIVFYHPERLETGEWGDDNTRLSAEGLPEIAERYFGVRPINPGASRMIYRNGMFYWQETGGMLPMGFALTQQAEDLGGGRLGVSFEVYGAGEDWEPEGVCLLSSKQAAAAFPYGGRGRGYAVIRTAGSDNPEDWILERYARRMGE